MLFLLYCQGLPEVRASPNNPQASQVSGLLPQAEVAGQGVTALRTSRAEGGLQRQGPSGRGSSLMEQEVISTLKCCHCKQMQLMTNYSSTIRSHAVLEHQHSSMQSSCCSEMLVMQGMGWCQEHRRQATVSQDCCRLAAILHDPNRRLLQVRQTVISTAARQSSALHLVALLSGCINNPWCFCHQPCHLPHVMHCSFLMHATD